VLRRRRLSPLAWSAILVIALPTLVGAVYYGLIATNQYASDVRFSIRGNDTSSADLFSGLSGMLGTSKSLQDSYLVSSYLTSREVVEDVDKKVPLRAIYTKPFIDYLSRLETDAPIDELVEYWQNMVTVAVDETSNTVSVEIRAFSAEDSKAIGIALVEASENLLNRISDRAREDAMRTSVAMSKETEKRVLAAREAFRQFRDQQGNLDPVTTAQSMLGMVSSLTQAKLLLEQDLATRRSSQGAELAGGDQPPDQAQDDRGADPGFPLAGDRVRAHGPDHHLGSDGARRGPAARAGIRREDPRLPRSPRSIWPGRRPTARGCSSFRSCGPPRRRSTGTPIAPFRS
jgi:capsule polysaccharide export protein KpsE/RkpR